VLSGRGFNAFDRPDGMPVAIVNQRFASEHWRGEQALGKRLRLIDEKQPGDDKQPGDGKTPGPWLTVVGVVSDIVQNDFTRQARDPLVYLPYMREPQGEMYVFARTRVPSESLATAFRREVQALDPNLPVTELGTLTGRLQHGYAFRGRIVVLFVIFAALALLLASVGLYAVIARAVSQRTQEIGIRAALGASARDIGRLVFRQGMLPLGLGLGIGLAASFAVSRVLESELVGVSPADPVALMLASAVLVMAAALGCWLPARRAMRVDPVVALRDE
jgi:putative ABC transport system permease protein